ncbi:hypothetical protein FKV73_04425 [Weissella paramesenteroides]|nr:hypothetical protein FKV79_07210 [Weissella paramesenteroides]KAA8437929.1 hypothetical protein FKV73_04425 [Weissella paramesenteroides]
MLEKHTLPTSDEATNYKKLTPKERVKALQLAQSLDANNDKSILEYGLATQKNLLEFYQKITMTSHAKDIHSGINDALNMLKPVIDQIDANQLMPIKQGFLAHVFNNMQATVDALIEQYRQISADVAEISNQLHVFQQEMINENEWLTSVYQENELYAKKISISQAGAAMKLTDIEKRELPSAIKITEITQIQQLDQFKKLLLARIKNLDLTSRLIANQSVQIQALKANNQSLIDEISINFNTVLAAWQNQFVLTLTLFSQKQIGYRHKKNTSLQVSESTENIQQLQQVQQHLIAITTAVKIDQRSSYKKIKVLEQKMQTLIGRLNQLIDNAMSYD